MKKSIIVGAFIIALTVSLAALIAVFASREPNKKLCVNGKTFILRGHDKSMYVEGKMVVLIYSNRGEYFKICRAMIGKGYEPIDDELFSSAATQMKNRVSARVYSSSLCDARTKRRSFPDVTVFDPSTGETNTIAIGKVESERIGRALRVSKLVEPFVLAAGYYAFVAR